MSDDTKHAMVEVARAGDLFAARLIVGRLVSEGILARIPGESMLETYDGAAAIWAGGVPVEVPSDRAEEARRVLSEPVEEPGDQGLD